MKKEKEFKFKILILGTSDRLRAEFLSLISQKSWRIDGVSGHFHSTDGVTLDIWFPRENASSKVLASFSYEGANGVVMVMGRRYQRALRRMKRTIRERVGKVPYVAFVLRKNMSEGEKATKSLYAVRLLSDRMKEVSLMTEVKEAPRKRVATPTSIAGKPKYTVDQFGFIVPDSSKGVPLFSEETQKKAKAKK
ncbi:MAG: hypothetical protein HWN65_02925 [Candidatus Helarchaeota archaeon]|nr:hypothetical protein [Candidatus Helarchaeota archaeon]